MVVLIMNDLRELARNSLESYDQAVSSERQRLSQVMNGALGRVALEGHIARAKQADRNYELVNQFASLLPQVVSSPEDTETKPIGIGNVKWSFNVGNEDQNTARSLQSAIIWTNYKGSSNQPAYPYYVLGGNASGRKSSLLLVAARRNHQIPRVNSRYGTAWEPQVLIKQWVPTKELQAYEERSQHQRGQPYTAAELSIPGFFNHQNGNFKLTAHGPGTKIAKTRSYVWEMIVGGDECIRKREGILPFKGGEILKVLSHEDFLSHDVFGGMTDLASRFGKVAGFDRLIQESEAFAPIEV